MLLGTELVMGKDKVNRLSQVPLSNSAVKKELLFHDIKDQILDQINMSLFFAIHCHKMKLYTERSQELKKNCAGQSLKLNLL